MKRPSDDVDLRLRSGDHLSFNPDSHDHNFPHFRKPTIVGSFSVDCHRSFLHDRSQLKFYRPRPLATPLDLDLNEGMASVVRKNEEECKEEGLKMMLKWILQNPKRFLVNQGPLKDLSTDFVCFRGLLTNLMCSPYENREGWEFTAVKWKNTIYLRKEETSEQKNRRLNATKREKTMCSWGYKFEQLMMSDTPQLEKPNTKEPVVEPEEFCCVYRTRLGPHSLVYGAEMDGLVVSDRLKKSHLDADLNLERFVELKTSRMIEHRGHERTLHRFKMIKWWSQSFVVGIGSVVCGFRDDDGVVRGIEEFSLRDMPELGKEHWKGNVCMNFLQEALSMVKAVMAEEVGEMEMVRFSWAPKVGMVVEKLGEKTQDVLPEWYLNSVFQS